MKVILTWLSQLNGSQEKKNQRTKNNMKNKDQSHKFKNNMNDC